MGRYNPLNMDDDDDIFGEVGGYICSVFWKVAVAAAAFGALAAVVFQPSFLHVDVPGISQSTNNNDTQVNLGTHMLVNSEGNFVFQDDQTTDVWSVKNTHDKTLFSVTNTGSVAIAGTLSGGADGVFFVNGTENGVVLQGNDLAILAVQDGQVLTAKNTLDDSQGNAGIASNLKVGGDVAAASASVSGDASVGGTLVATKLNVSNATFGNIEATKSIKSDGTLAGAANVLDDGVGNASIANNLTVAGNAVVAGNLTVTNLNVITFTKVNVDTINVTGDASFQSVTSETSITAARNTLDDGVGNAGIVGTLTAHGPVLLNSTVTTSRSTLDDGSGNAVFGGSLSAANVNLPGNISINGTLYARNGISTLYNTLDDGVGGASVAGTLTVQGATLLNGTTVNTRKNLLDDGQGNANIAGTLSVTNLSVTTFTKINVDVINVNGGAVFQSLTSNSTLSAAQNTLDDGLGNVNIMGNIVMGAGAPAVGIMPKMAATAAGGVYMDSNYGNIHFAGGPTGSESWNVQDQNGVVQFKVYNSLVGSAPTRGVKTYLNTLDDGTGSMIVAGILTSNTVKSNSTNALVLQGVNPTGVVQIWNNGLLALNTFSGKVLTGGGNTLDNGSGAMTIVGTLTQSSITSLGSGNLPYTMLNTDVWVSLAASVATAFSITLPTAPTAGQTIVLSCTNSVLVGTKTLVGATMWYNGVSTTSIALMPMMTYILRYNSIATTWSVMGGNTFGNALYISGTNPVLRFQNSGIAGPGANGVLSAGMKIVTYDDGVYEFGIGIDTGTQWYVTGQYHKFYYQSGSSRLLALTLSNNVITTGGGNTLDDGNGAMTVVGGTLALSSATSNLLSFGTAGGGAPTFTTRSIGTKIVLFPNIGAAAVDYALGIGTNAMWSSVATTNMFFQWYGGTTVAATLTGGGSMTLTGGITVNGGGTNPLTVLNPSMGATFSTFAIGQAISNYNSAFFQFNYGGGAGSTSNYLRLGVTGTQAMTIYGSNKIQTQAGTVLDDGSGNMAIAGTTTLTGVVTLLNDLYFNSATRRTIGPSGNLVVGNVDIQLSSANQGTVWLNQDSKAPVKTGSNIVDDGSGNAYVAGYVAMRGGAATTPATLHGLYGGASIVIQTAFGSPQSGRISFGDGTGWQMSIATRQASAAYAYRDLINITDGGKITTSGGNTLDDGSGNVVIAGNLNVNGVGNTVFAGYAVFNGNGNFPAGKTLNFGSGLQISAGADGSISIWDLKNGGQWLYRNSANALVGGWISTKNNLLDNGVGGMTVAGTLTQTSVTTLATVNLPYTILNTDVWIMVTSNSATALAITLPTAPFQGQQIVLSCSSAVLVGTKTLIGGTMLYNGVSVTTIALTPMATYILRYNTGIAAWSVVGGTAFGPQLSLTGTNPVVRMVNTGIAPPSNSGTLSAGMKIITWDDNTYSFGIGIDSATQWYISGVTHKFYYMNAGVPTVSLTLSNKAITTGGGTTLDDGGGNMFISSSNGAVQLTLNNAVGGGTFSQMQYKLANVIKASTGWSTTTGAFIFDNVNSNYLLQQGGTTSGVLKTAFNNFLDDGAGNIIASKNLGASSAYLFGSGVALPYATQANATLITNQYSMFRFVDPGGAVILPSTPIGGSTYSIINGDPGGNAITVYPPLTWEFNRAAFTDPGANNPLYVPAGSAITFLYVAGVNYYFALNAPLRYTGAKATSTQNNVLDDGTGKMTLASDLTVSQYINGNAANPLVIGGKNTGGVVQIWNNAVMALNTFSGQVLTGGGNTLDDSTGNMLVKKDIQATTANLNFHIAPTSGAGNRVGFSSSSKAAWGLVVTENGNTPKANTFLNQLDDGTGAMIVAGTVQIQAKDPLSMLNSGLATSTTTTSYLGVAQSNYNSAIWQFFNAGAGSTSNYVRMGLYGTSAMTIYGSNKIQTASNTVLDDGSGNMNIAGYLSQSVFYSLSVSNTGTQATAQLLGNQYNVIRTLVAGSAAILPSTVAVGTSITIVSADGSGIGPLKVYPPVGHQFNVYGGSPWSANQAMLVPLGTTVKVVYVSTGANNRWEIETTPMKYGPTGALTTGTGNTLDDGSGRMVVGSLAVVDPGTMISNMYLESRNSQLVPNILTSNGYAPLFIGQGPGGGVSYSSTTGNFTSNSDGSNRFYSMVEMSSGLGTGAFNVYMGSGGGAAALQLTPAQMKNTKVFGVANGGAVRTYDGSTGTARNTLDDGTGAIQSNMNTASSTIPLTMYNAGMVGVSFSTMVIGKDSSAYNTGQIQFAYAGSGSTSNAVALQVSSRSGLTITGAGRITTFGSAGNVLDDGSGSMTTTGFPILTSIQTGITVTGTSIATAAPTLSKAVNVISTNIAGGGGYVMLPSGMATGTMLRIYNVANNGQVFVVPQSGGTVNSGTYVGLSVLGNANPYTATFIHLGSNVWVTG